MKNFRDDLLEFTKRVEENNSYFGVMHEGPLDGQMWRVDPDSEEVVFRLYKNDKTFECIYVKDSIHSLFIFNYEFLFMERI